MEVNMDKIKFKRILGMKGESLGVTIPQELIEYLDLKNGDEMVFTAEKGKHGRFAALFKEK
jgi:bifunctional DNA-binding transcriptional regulator/antitoxin component of YhaV-PrlF toxin-antitoxin module|tara:strand:+ start:963 stop:1145 length:183 start_codon:yes stop_codon:yes gene_type:complete